MSNKLDRKALMRSSLQKETASVDQRFARAEAAMEGRPQGLAGPKTHDTAPLVSVENKIPSHTSNRSIVRVLISQAHDNHLNARQIYDPEEIKSISASIAVRGQLVPAPAIRHPELPGHVILIDGHYRKRGLLAAGKTEIECDIHDVTNELDMYRLSFLINQERSGQSPLDNALSWQHLLQTNVVEDGEGIAELTGLSPGAVTKTMSLLKLPESAIEKIRDQPGKFGVAIGYELFRCSKLIDEKALLDLMEKVVAEGISSRGLEAYREKLEKNKPRKKKEVSRQYKISIENTEVGFIKEWDSGKVSLEVNLQDPRLREELVDELKKRFHLHDS